MALADMSHRRHPRDGPGLGRRLRVLDAVHRGVEVIAVRQPRRELRIGPRPPREDDHLSRDGECAHPNQQDPFVLYMTALAAEGQGDAAKAKELARRAADMHILPTLNYVIIRAKAQHMAGEYAPTPR